MFSRISLEHTTPLPETSALGSNRHGIMLSFSTSAFWGGQSLLWGLFAGLYLVECLF